MSEVDPHHKRTDKPQFHVAPKSGWVNDPNGPFMYRGHYHLFYQHLPEGCEWGFGLVWGHSVSTDLVHWQQLPHAMVPTAKSLDADGCFSGCAAVDTDGTPVLLYTGVRLRTSPDALPHPPPECDLNLPFIEAQLYATPANLDDPFLVHWVKEATPFIALPPPNMNLTGWRDPFVVERPCAANNQEWVVLMGSGIKGVGGATIVYRTNSLRDAAAWRYDGMLCVGQGDTGAVWECPLLAQLNPVPAGGVALGSTAHTQLATGSHAQDSNTWLQLKDGATCDREAHHLSSPEQLNCNHASRSTTKQQQQSGAAAQKGSSTSGSTSSTNHGIALCGSTGSCGPLGLVNPTGGPPPGCNMSQAVSGSWDERYTHFYSISPDACTNPTIYWLGRYTAGRFDIDNAKGPLRLDLGDVLYAPNIMRDDAGRVLMWGWLQERRTVGTYDYAGCMTVPRLLHLDRDRLVQSPSPELLSLRRGEAWEVKSVHLAGPQAPLSVPGLVGSSALDIEVVFRQGSASTVGILLCSWQQSGEGGAAVLYNWESGLLEVVFEALDPATMTFSLTAPTARRIGGPTHLRPGQPLALRVLLDYSCLEIFTGTGEVLSTRVYRGTPPRDHAGAGIEFLALDGDATIERVGAYEMSSIWVDAPVGRKQLSLTDTSSAKLQDLAGAEAAVSADMVALKVQQLAVSQTAAAGVGLGAVHQQPEMLEEEQLCADIFEF